MAAIGGFMSFFSSTMGVVTPALFPLVPNLAEASGIDAAVLFSAIGYWGHKLLQYLHFLRVAA